ncbi:hypothetical protein [Microbacterium sp. BLY]|uniref:hypothetical protein n=1 Tax=Microbacterium sp. BLY TaxID=2823280 RepID=UPI001B32F0F1|nr:hypothetical protein [Microbacterium sp. BLY]MBP3976409.1 hypothetical protein [Microbacterium sp. BLY]
MSRAAFPAFAVALAIFAALATLWAAPELTIRYASFATMIAALASAVVAARRGPAGLRAASAVVAVITLMLGSTFFGLTYS